MAVGGCHSIWGHNNQPKVGVGNVRDIREVARPWQTVCGECFAVVWDGKLRAKISKIKNDVKKHNNQPKASSLDGGGIV